MRAKGTDRGHTADALAQLAKIVNSTLELDEVLDLALRQLARVIDYDSASVLLADGPDLMIAAGRGFKNPDAVVGKVFRLEENNISHQVMQTRQVRVVPDVQALAEWGHDRDDLEGAHTIRAWMGVPLIVREQCIGMLAVDKYEPDVYTDEDGETVEAFAAQIASAIQNARLFRSELRKRQTAAALLQLSQIVNSTLELNEVLELALDQLAQVVSFDTASILLVEGANLVIAACRGFMHPDRLLGSIITPDEVNLAYQVLRGKKTRVISDVQQEPAWGHIRDHIADMRAIRAWIGAPIIVRDQGIGVLTIDKHQPGFYTDEDRETATAFAAQMATAIHNARLYQATQQQRDRLAAILTDTSDAVIVLDTTDRIWLLNPAAERRLKLERSRTIGLPIHVLGLSDLTKALQSAQQIARPMTCEIASPDSMAFYNASLAPVRDVGWVIVMQDITPLKELDRLRTEWVATVSHDLKNPIQVVQLGAALLEMDGPLNEMQRERIMIIQRSAEQLSALVTGVLDLARLEAGPALRLAPLNLQDVIMAAIAEIQHLATKKQQTIATNLLPDCPVIMGDGVLLGRALVNLLSNAIKYTHTGGEISVRCTVMDEALQIQVADNGQGIPGDALPHLFERFYRVPGTVSEGTGLGLSIVKSIVEKHGGYVGVSSAPGKGSEFTLALPIVHPADSP